MALLWKWSATEGILWVLATLYISMVLCLASTCAMPRVVLYTSFPVTCSTSRHSLYLSWSNLPYLSWPPLPLLTCPTSPDLLYIPWSHLLYFPWLCTASLDMRSISELALYRVTCSICPCDLLYISCLCLTLVLCVLISLALSFVTLHCISRLCTASLYFALHL